MEISGQGLRIAAVATGALANILTSAYYSSMKVVEQEGMWTLRLWLTTLEKYIYSLGAVVITTAFVLDVWALYRGEDVDASVLFLSVEVGVFLTGVLYQAHRTHVLRVLMYRAWSGPSRTSCSSDIAWLNCVPAEDWVEAIKRAESSDFGHTYPTESRLNPQNMVRWWTKRTWCDVTAVSGEASTHLTRRAGFNFHTDFRMDSSSIIYYPFTQNNRMSVLWGAPISRMFQRRVSRGILTYDAEKVNNAFSVGRADRPRSVMIARGVLARTKGFAPKLLLFRSVYEIGGVNVDVSPHFPRPSKTSIEHFRDNMDEEFSGISSAYVNAATELALLIVDIPPARVSEWLRLQREQEDIEWSWSVQRLTDGTPARKDDAVKAVYRLSYVVMVTCLNMGTSVTSAYVARRPEATVLVIWAVSESPETMELLEAPRNKPILRDRLKMEEAYANEDTASVVLFYLGRDDDVIPLAGLAVEKILQLSSP